MKHWDSSHYLRYSTERTRAAVDLLARVNLPAPRRIADIGCGPGNSTALLWSRWPDSKVVGIDNSSEMLATARTAYPEREWIECNARQWRPSKPYDLVFSNAALQWLPEHSSLVQMLFEQVATGGALAFQVPSAQYALVRRLIFEISQESPWDQQMQGPRSRLTIEPPEFYYDALASEAETLDIWETDYMHVMESHEAILDWISSTGLRPFLNALDTDADREAFTNELRHRIASGYELRIDGKVLFPFRRTFVIAYR
ncbi:MAG: methyltransferase domain-containing protein [Cyanobacteria bacterium P01_H01_bin.15]